MRVTRAAMRAHVQDESLDIHEDPNVPQEQELHDDENRERPALKDITDGNSSTADDLAEPKPASTQKAKTRKKGKATKKNTVELVEQTEEPDTQKEEQTQEAINPGHLQLPPSKAIKVDQLDQSATPPALEQTPEQHPGEVAGETSQTPKKEPTAITKTPKFDPELHMPAESPREEEPEAKEDSFVDSIKSRSPTKLTRASAELDSFVEHITSRSPARRVSRIEDSVEAMDALEDAIEQISGSLPELERLEVDSPTKTHKQSPAKPTPLPALKIALDASVVNKTPNTARLSSAKAPKSAKVSPTKGKTAQPKPAPPRTTSGRVSTAKPTSKAPVINKSTSRTTNVVPKTAPSTAPTSQMSFSNSTLKQQPNIVKKRVTSGPLSTSKPAFVPVKSTKPPTKSTFILPGEAIAAKFKAQREERAKKEEAERAKPQFKARAVPPKTSRPSVMPRENKASQARTSMIRTGSNKENVAPRPIPSKVTKPATSLSVAKTRPDTTKANSSVRRITTTAPRASLAPRVASQSAGQKLMVTKEDVAQQKVRGKEVFGRAKAEKEQAEKEKREKEEAAKKARAEAAERGRQASREWAEKQKKKLEAQKATKAAHAAVVPVIAPTA